MTKKIKKEVQILLTETIPNLGQLDNLVYVKSGYARNFLLPLQRAKRSTLAIIKKLEKKQKNIELKEKLNLEFCLKNKIILEQMENFIIYKRISEDKKIFGKITLKQVRTVLENKTNIDFSKALIEIPEVKELGSFYAHITLHPNVKTKVKINILPNN